MRKEPNVTRQLKTMKVNCLCVNTETAEVTNETFHVGRVIADDNDIIKYIKSNYAETLGNTKVVDIVDKEILEKLYVMPQSKFVSLAIEAEPRKGE